MKEALKEAPKDDEEAERHETGEIDKGFTSEEEEDELTEEGVCSVWLMVVYVCRLWVCLHSTVLCVCVSCLCIPTSLLYIC